MRRWRVCRSTSASTRCRVANDRRVRWVSLHPSRLQRPCGARRRTRGGAQPMAGRSSCDGPGARGRRSTRRAGEPCWPRRGTGRRRRWPPSAATAGRGPGARDRHSRRAGLRAVAPRRTVGAGSRAHRVRVCRGPATRAIAPPRSPAVASGSTRCTRATLESRRAPGLFFCGEVLDAFGPIGGHNFCVGVVDRVDRRARRGRGPHRLTDRRLTGRLSTRY